MADVTVTLTTEEASSVLGELHAYGHGHGSEKDDFEAECPNCTAADKIAAALANGVPVRVLAGADPFCPKCGHNRDTSSVSSIDHGTHQACQLCGTAWQELPAVVLPSEKGEA